MIILTLLNLMMDFTTYLTWIIMDWSSIKIVLIIINLKTFRYNNYTLLTQLLFSESIIVSLLRHLIEITWRLEVGFKLALRYHACWCLVVENYDSTSHRWSHDKAVLCLLPIRRNLIMLFGLCFRRVSASPPQIFFFSRI